MTGASECVLTLNQPVFQVCDHIHLFITYLANISLVWSVSMELSALTITARADVTPAFSSLFTLCSMKSFLSWANRESVNNF